MTQPILQIIITPLLSSANDQNPPLADEACGMFVLGRDQKGDAVLRLMHYPDQPTAAFNLVLAHLIDTFRVEKKPSRRDVTELTLIRSYDRESSM